MADGIPSLANQLEDVFHEAEDSAPEQRRPSNYFIKIPVANDFKYGVQSIKFDSRFFVIAQVNVGGEQFFQFASLTPKKQPHKSNGNGDNQDGQDTSSNMSHIAPQCQIRVAHTHKNNCGILTALNERRYVGCGVHGLFRKELAETFVAKRGCKDNWI